MRSKHKATGSSPVYTTLYFMLKRTGFKRKLNKPMKRTTINKVSKKPISLIQKKLWELCRQIIKPKYGNVCYTCGKTGLEGSGWHVGHFIPKAACGAYLKYDLRNLRPQCYHCNINLGGNGSIYYRNMVEREGQEYVDKLFEDKNVVVKAYDHYIMLIDKYTKLL